MVTLEPDTSACHTVDKVLKAAHVQNHEEVDIRDEAGRIVIEPVREKNCNLDDLLKRITKDNIHRRDRFRLVGRREVW